MALAFGLQELAQMCQQLQQQQQQVPLLSCKRPSGNANLSSHHASSSSSSSRPLQQLQT
jgi:hypothetical protein